MELAGISASPGIARGKAFLFLEDRLSVPRYDITALQVDAEYDRFLSALDAAAAEVKRLVAGRDGALFEAQLLMFEDPELKDRVHALLGETRRNVEWVFLQILDEMSGKLAKADSQYLRERTVDFADAGNRILGALMARTRIRLSDIREPVVLVTRTLMPSDTLGLDRAYILGIAADGGERRRTRPSSRARTRYPPCSVCPTSAAACTPATRSSWTATRAP